jgi:recombination protein RecA
MTSTDATKETELVKKEVSKKETAASKVPTGNQVGALTRALIFKATGHKPIEPTFKTHPHVDSGSIVINSLIGGSSTRDGKGQVCPGYPRRKITEIYGPESSGKTTIALCAAAQIQRAGGSVLFLDFEHSLHHGYAEKIGVKFGDSFQVVAPDTMEEGLRMVYLAIGTGVDLIIVDSVAAMVPAKELERKLNEDAKVGVVAKKMAETLPKIVHWLATFPKVGSGEAKRTDLNRPGTALILLNQERAAISTTGGGHGPETNTAGGKAIKFYASVRLRFQKWKTEVIERNDPMSGKKKKFPYGVITGVTAVKAKMDAKQGHNGSIFIRYGFGLDNYYSVIETGVGSGVVKKEGAYYAFEDNRFQGRDKFRAFLIANEKVYEALKKQIQAIVVESGGVALSDEELTDDDSLLENVSSAVDEDEASEEEAVEEAVEADDATTE